MKMFRTALRCGYLFSSSVVMLSSLRLRYWSTDFRVPLIEMSFFSCSVCQHLGVVGEEGKRAGLTSTVIYNTRETNSKKQIWLDRDQHGSQNGRIAVYLMVDQCLKKGKEEHGVCFLASGGSQRVRCTWRPLAMMLVNCRGFERAAKHQLLGQRKALALISQHD